MKEMYVINTKRNKNILPKYKNSDVENCSSESEGELEIVFYCFCLIGFYII